MTQRTIPATYMRGGTSKGVFFRGDALPAAGAQRDAILLRVIGSPDPYGKQTDGMGAATSSTSKVVIVSPSTRPDCDVDYLFGQVSIDAPLIDWTGNCGNLTAAVGPFAIANGLIQAPGQGLATVRIWQANLGKRIIAYVPMQGGQVVEDGDFELDGVAFPAAEVRIEFLDPGGSDAVALFPTGNPVDVIDVPGVGKVEATLINAGNPTIIVHAPSVGLRGNELQSEVNGDQALLDRLEKIRAQGSVMMGIAATTEEATHAKPSIPKLAFVASPIAYTASSGKQVGQDDIDLTTRILSMGVLHHALTGTGAIAFAVAAAIPGTLARRFARDGWSPEHPLRLGHTSGTLAVGAQAAQSNGEWVVSKASVSRSARRLMIGQVLVPERVFAQ